MGLIHDKQANILHILSLFPSSGKDVPLLWSADNDVTFSQ